MSSKPITYIRFRPTTSVKEVSQQIYDQVYMRSPLNSDVKFRIEKQGKIYVVYGSVDSSVGTFVGYAASKDLYSALASMGGQIERGLKITKRGVENYETNYRKSG